MARVTVSKAQWAAARAIWESDPRISQAQIAESLGATRQAVQKHAKQNGWVKQLNMEAIAERAHEAADSKYEKEAAASATGPALVVGGVSKNQHGNFSDAFPHVSAGATEEAARTLAVDAAVERRAEVLNTHRKEWLALRTLTYAAIKNRDMESARHVKTCAESLKIVQDGERKAWGLDTDEKKPPAVTVTINRRAGVTIGH